MIEQPSVDFLQQLSEAFGPSGFEREPTRMLRDYVQPFVDQVETDKLGSLIFTKQGSTDAPVVLLPGHIDEVGFIVSGITKQGFLSFNPIGGWFDQVLLAQRVIVRTRKGDLQGVIASKPPHLLTVEDRRKVVKMEKMFIDIGASCKEEVQEMGVRVGDPIGPDSRFTTIVKPVFKEKKKTGETTLCMGKAFDNRVGVFIAAEVIRRLAEEKIEHSNKVVGAGTVLEEVGLRGARTSAWVVDPDLCLTLDVDIAKDIAGMDQPSATIKMGEGPTILTYDSSMVPNQGLKEFVIDTAEANKIPYQLSQIRRGGTDAGAIHLTHAGCPSLVLSVPTRHIHSHVSIVNLEDISHCIDLVLSCIQGLDQSTVESFTAI